MATPTETTENHFREFCALRNNCSWLNGLNNNYLVTLLLDIKSFASTQRGKEKNYSASPPI